jgi:hypothetical protein
MAEQWVRCPTGNCIFKDGIGTSQTLPEPREVKEKKKNVKPTDNLVYDAISDPGKAACPNATCACFIVVQGLDEKNNIESESLFAANGDAAPYEVGNYTVGPLTKTDVDQFSKKQAENPTRTFNYTFACIKTELRDDGRRVPVHK